jgi:hypothetical protein
MALNGLRPESYVLNYIGQVIRSGDLGGVAPPGVSGRSSLVQRTCRRSQETWQLVTQFGPLESWLKY